MTCTASRRSRLGLTLRSAFGGSGSWDRSRFKAGQCAGKHRNGRARKSRPKAAFRSLKVASGGQYGRPRFPAISHEADAGEAKDQHRPGRGLGNGADLYRHVAQLLVVCTEELEIEGVDAGDVGVEIQAWENGKAQIFAILIEWAAARRI